MFDLHVHAAPDIVARRAGDAQVLDWYREAGFSGCVLKAHYDSTAGRAAAGTGDGLAVYGGQALNQHVGGINPAAVAAALAMGARVIWMPTADARAPGVRGVARLCSTEPDLADVTYALPPVDTSTEVAARRVIESVARADAVLATGHVSAAETAWLVQDARRAGVRRILLTHPTFVVPAMSPGQVRALTDLGCHAEVTAYQLIRQYRGDPAPLVELISTVGYGKLVLSSDMGQPGNPTPPDALALLVDVLAGAGLDRAALLACASEIPERLVTP
jgi:hypothetical protein